MRIIAGKYRGRNLKSPPSLEVRPTSDRLRETLFNVLAPSVEGASFLDLCAGSGAIGIEALSRGASHVTFVDRSRKMCALIKANLELCNVESTQSAVFSGEVVDFLRRLPKKPGVVAPWNIIFFDPPYASDYLPVLKTFGKQTAELLAESGLLVVEHHHKTQLIDSVGSIMRNRILKQGDSALSFFARMRS